MSWLLTKRMYYTSCLCTAMSIGFFASYRHLAPAIAGGIIISSMLKPGIDIYTQGYVSAPLNFTPILVGAMTVSLYIKVLEATLASTYPALLSLQSW